MNEIITIDCKEKKRKRYLLNSMRLILMVMLLILRCMSPHLLHGICTYSTWKGGLDISTCFVFRFGVLCCCQQKRRKMKPITLLPLILMMTLISSSSFLCEYSLSSVIIIIIIHSLLSYDYNNSLFYSNYIFLIK